MNDVKGWLLVHQQIRGVLTQALEHVGALRPEQPAAAKAFVDWWMSFSRSFAHHMHTEDGRIWPTLAAAHAPQEAVNAVLTHQHHEIEKQLQRVDAAISALPSQLNAADFAATRDALLAQLTALRTAVLEHLEHEERTAFVAGAERVSASEWSLVEKDMVKGLSLKDVSTLMPRILENASPEDRAVMLGRVPFPVRFLVTKVFEPRYQRARAALPK